PRHHGRFVRASARSYRPREGGAKASHRNSCSGTATNSSSGRGRQLPAIAGSAAVKCLTALRTILFPRRPHKKRETQITRQRPPAGPSPYGSTDRFAPAPDAIVYCPDGAACSGRAASLHSARPPLLSSIGLVAARRCNPATATGSYGLAPL